MTGKLPIYCSFGLLVIGHAIAIQNPTMAATPEPAPESEAFPPEITRLVRSLLLQIDLAYRHDHRTRASRTETVHQALQAWHNAPRRAEEDHLFQEWLRDSIRRSAPDQRKPLLPAPLFNRSGRITPESGHILPHVSEPQRAVAIPQSLVWPQTRILTEPWITSTPTWPVRQSRASLDMIPIGQVRSAAGPERVRMAARSCAVASKIPQKTTKPILPTTVSTISSIPAGSYPVQINRDELISRFVGYRLGLRKMEAQLAGTGTKSARELALIAQELEILTEQYELLTLYCLAIGADASWTDTSLRTTETAWNYMRQAIEARRRVLAGRELPLAAEKRHVEQSILEAIERRMADHAGGKPTGAGQQ
ncbi:MAG: hypothetical protein JW829_09365 [Pirellulales bacterium]|nr:hypothetical protein [Pirellulales bacterium]